MEITFSGKYEKQQYIKGFRRVLLPLTWRTVLGYVYIFGFMVLLVGMAITEWNGDGFQPSEISRLLRYGVLVLILAGVAIYNLFRVRKVAVRMWLMSELTGGVRGYVSAEGIHLYSQLQPWLEFIKKDVRQDMVVLMTNGRRIAVFSRALFQSDSDWERFVQLVERKVIEPK